MQLVHWILMACASALLAWAFYRWKTSAASSPDYGARREVMFLMLLLLAGVIGDAIRAKFPEGSPAFLVASLVLIPLAGAALVILFRMFSAFRKSQTSSINSGGGPRGRRE